MAKKSKKEPDKIKKLAHDMRTPLSVLKQYLSFVPTPEDNDLKDFHEAAVKSLGSLCDLVEELKDTPELMHFRPQTVNLPDIIEEVIKTMRPIAAKSNVVLKYVGTKTAEGMFDTGMVERLLTNLIKNAIEAFDGKGGAVDVYLRQGASDLWIEIRDNACGIPGHIVQRIFEKDFTYGKTGGTGLGLEICKDIITVHGGKIGVHSVLGHGTVFTITFPRSPETNGFPVNPTILHEDSLH